MAETKFDTTAIENERKALQLLAEEVQKTDDADARDALIDAIQKSADKLKSSVRIPDATGVLTKNMAHIEPDYIEECAMKQAKAFKEMCEEIEKAAE